MSTLVKKQSPKPLFSNIQVEIAKFSLLNFMPLLISHDSFSPAKASREENSFHSFCIEPFTAEFIAQETLCVQRLTPVGFV